MEGCLVNDPLKERLDLDVETGIGILAGYDTVDGRIGITGTLVVVCQAVLGSVLGVLDESSESIGGANGVFAGNDCERSLVCALIDGFGNDGGNELEDIGTDGASDLEHYTVGIWQRAYAR